MEKQKFKAGDRVKLSRRNLFGEDTGVIEHVDIELKATHDEDSSIINPHGPSILESELKDIRLPYERVGDSVIITYAKTRGGGLYKIRYIPLRYVYAISTRNDLVHFPQSGLKLIKP